jgi:hypothetical protein
MFVSEDGIITYEDDVDCDACANWGCDECVEPGDAPLRAGENCGCELCA